MDLKIVKKHMPLYCSFCGKEKGDVGYLIAGPTVFICNECVEVCRAVGQQGLDDPERAIDHSVDKAWQSLLEKDDRTSPADYPEMCLITKDELAEYMTAVSKGTGA